MFLLSEEYSFDVCCILAYGESALPHAHGLVTSEYWNMRRNSSIWNIYRRSLEKFLETCTFRCARPIFIVFAAICFLFCQLFYNPTDVLTKSKLSLHLQTRGQAVQQKRSNARIALWELRRDFRQKKDSLPLDASQRGISASRPSAIRKVNLL